MPFCSLNRRGVALPLALFTLVIAAVMITAVFYVGRLEQRMGNNSVAATQAFEAAETGVEAVMDSWSATAYSGLANGATVALPVTAVGPNAVYAATVRRLNPQQYLIQSDGRYLIDGQVITRRQVARLVRRNPFGISPEGAVVTRLRLEVRGTGQIDGQDDTPPLWGGVCSGSGPDAPAVVDSSAEVVTTGPCTGQVCLTGSPKILDDPANVSTNSFNQLGAISFSDLAASADKTVGGTLGTLGPTYDSGPTCRTSDLLNWGAPDDPSGPCGGYFPIIYSPGDLALQDGVGQGILLVDGSLTMTGNARFYGIVVVTHLLDLQDGQIIGTVHVNGDGGVSSFVSGTRIDFSRCAIDRASSRVTQVEPIRERGWIQLY